MRRAVPACRRGALCAEQCRLVRRRSTLRRAVPASEERGALCAEQCRLVYTEGNYAQSSAGMCTRRETLRRAVPACTWWNTLYAQSSAGMHSFVTFSHFLLSLGLFVTFSHF